MNNNEILLVEALSNMLSDNVELGLAYHGDKEETSHKAELDHQMIEQEFKQCLNTPKVSNYDAIVAAFHHSHSYKDINHMSFGISFEKQMDGMGISSKDKQLAFNCLNKILKSYGFDINFELGEILDKRFIRPHQASPRVNAGGANMKELRKVSGTNNE